MSIPMSRAVARVNGVDIFYCDTGTSGPVILCLHGRWGRGETWIDFMERYGDRYRVLAPDQRGHGLSGKPVAKYTSEEMAADMIALLDSLGIASCIAVGHSMGGSVAGHMAALYPGRVDAVAILDKSAAGPAAGNETPLDALIAIDPVTKDWPMPFRSFREAKDFIRKEMGSALSYDYFMNSLVETVDGYVMMFSQQAMAANIAYYRDWFDLLPLIRCPALLIKARGEGAVTREDFSRMRSALRRCVSYEMPNEDHNVHLSDTAEFYGYMDAFLSSLE